MSSRASNFTSLASVARRAKVSIATASRVLNDSGSVVAQTRELVNQAARELNYQPNRRFRLMGKCNGKNSAATGNFGILLPSLDEATFAADPYWGRLFWSMEQSASQHRRHVLISRLSTENPTYLPDLVADMKVDGVFIVTRCAADLIARVQKLVPAVLVDALPEGASVSAIMPDEASGINKAVNYLYQLGHRRIFYFAIADSPNPNHTLRKEAFISLGHKLGLDQARAIVLPGRDKTLQETAADQLKAWQAADLFPTALVCGADVYAFAFIDAAHELGIRIPEDLSVIGADDLLPCEHVRPKLTSLRQPLEAMGRAAVRMLMEEIEGKEISKSVQRFEVELIKRQSCRELNCSN